MPYNQHNFTTPEDWDAQIVHRKELYHSSLALLDELEVPDREALDKALGVISTEENKVKLTAHHSSRVLHPRAYTGINKC
jgi:hypothetical protein